MSTRGTVTIREDGVVLARLYNHSDSYPSGLGQDLAQFILSGVFVNGIGLRDKKQFNGAGCFAAALIKELKQGPGGVYMIAKAQTEEFNYDINIDDAGASIFVRAGNKTIFKGSAQQLLSWSTAKVAS